MSELEQVVFDTTRAQMGPALGIDSSKDKLDLQTIQQAEHEEKLHSIQDSKRQLYEQYALGEIDLKPIRSARRYMMRSWCRQKCPCCYYRTDQTDTE